MTQQFSTKETRTLIVESASPSRQLITEVLRAKGFTNIQSVGTCKDALELLEVEPIDWVLAPLDAEQDVTCLHLLQLATVAPSLRETRFSVFVDDERKSAIPAIFEYGAISTHKRPFTKESLQKDMDSFLQTLETHSFNLTLVAATYLRQHLIDSKKHSELLRLEKTLLETFPGETRILLHFAEAQFLNEMKEKGFASLRLAKMLDESLDDSVKALLSKHAEFGEFAASQDASIDTNLLGIESAVVIDTDESVVSNIKNILTEQGVSTIESFDDGLAAFDYISANKDKIQLVVQEWRIPKLTGPLLLQRIRNEVGLSIPVVVASSLLKPEDIPLVREMSVSEVIEKPFEKPTFLKKLIWTLQQERMPTNQQALERKFRDALQRKNTKEAAEILRKYEQSDFPEARKNLLEAEFEYAGGGFEKARDLVFNSLKIGGDSLTALNVLGRILMQLRDFETALRCFEKAQKLSPQNIERICSMAEAHAELGDADAANASLAEASKMDGGAEVVQNARVKTTFISGDSAAVKSLMQQMQSMDEIIAFMNNKAVTLARCGKIDESIEQYRKAISSIPDDRVDYSASLLYNLALAYARNSDLEEAKLYIDKCLRLNFAKIKAKATALQKRLDRALNTGEAFAINASTADVPVSTSAARGPAAVATIAPANKNTASPNKPDQTVVPLETGRSKHWEIVGAMDISRGEIGCFMLFTPSEPHDATTKKMMKNLPRFTPRDAIERDESMGVEAGLKHSA